ncbi:MAG: alpha/beta fold hydrolase [Anaerolineales bacterium]
MKKNRGWLLLLLIPLLLVGFVIWASAAAEPLPQALAALESGEAVEVESDPWLTFRPREGEPDVGLILYPGGRVDPRAYAPAARAIAVEGYLVVIVPMPLNLAVLAPERAGEVIAAHPAIDAWAVGGHSLGGSMAARFAYRNPSRVDGLVLWASYPPESADLSEQSLVVASIYGTRDGLASPEEVEAARPLLPPDTTWIAIEGGNHAQFGGYGEQAGDNPATISREEQQRRVIEATLEVLSSLE